MQTGATQDDDNFTLKKFKLRFSECVWRIVSFEIVHKESETLNYLFEGICKLFRSTVHTISKKRRKRGGGGRWAHAIESDVFCDRQEMPLSQICMRTAKKG